MTDNLDMNECPVCGFPSTELCELLENIDDLSVLNGLACDMAERVADLTPDPSLSKAWIMAARSGQITKTQVGKAMSTWITAQDVWEKTGEEYGVGHPLEKAESSSRAVTLITPDAKAQTTQEELEGARDRVWEAAAAEEETATDLGAERAWQIRRVKERACTCRPLKGVLAGSRSRNSLLTTNHPF
jgi:hypothetical protein